MITITSKEKRVLVFKSPTHPPLRIFPGPNNIDVADIGELKSYFEGNRAAQGMFDEFCKDITGGKFNKEKAKIAKEKNDELNKAYALVKEKEKNIKKSEKDNKKLLEKIEKLNARLEELEEDKKDKKKGK